MTIKQLEEVGLEVYFELPTLRILSLSTSPEYTYFQIPKKGGTMRDIAAPCEDLMKIQTKIATQIISTFPLSENCFGFRKGLSIVDNAKVHVRTQLLINMDLKDFFPSVSRKQVLIIFAQFTKDAYLVQHLTNLCCLENHLPQGAPSSPTLANIAAFGLDNRLNEIAISYGFNYTRYADDLTFSLRTQMDSTAVPLDILFYSIKKAVWSTGFKLNPAKIRVGRSGERLEVTGLIVNECLNLPKKWMHNLRACIYNLMQSGIPATEEGTAAQAELQGKMALLKMVNYEKWEQFQKLTHQIKSAM